MEKVYHIKLENILQTSENKEIFRPCKGNKNHNNKPDIS